MVMYKKTIVSSLIFASIFASLWLINEQQKKEFIDLDDDQAYNLQVTPIKTEGTIIKPPRKVYKKYKSREYVRITNAKRRPIPK